MMNIIISMNNVRQGHIRYLTFNKFASIDPMDVEFSLRSTRSKDNKTEREYCLQSKRQSSSNDCKLVSAMDDSLMIEQLENKWINTAKTSGCLR